MIIETLTTIAIIKIVSIAVGSMAGGVIIGVVSVKAYDYYQNQEARKKAAELAEKLIKGLAQNETRVEQVFNNHSINSQTIGQLAVKGIEQVNKSSVAVGSEIDKIINENINLKRIIEDLRKIATERDTRLLALTKELDGAKQQFATNIQTISDLQRQLATNNQNLMVALDKLLQRDKELESATERFKQLCDKMNLLEQQNIHEISSLKEDKIKLTEEISHITEDYKQALTIINRLQATIDENEQQMEAYLNQSTSQIESKPQTAQAYNSSRLFTH